MNKTYERMQRIIRNTPESATKVSFINCGLDDDDIVSLKDLLEEKPHLTEIDLSSNNLTEESGEILAKIAQISRITLKRNGLGDKGVEVLLSKKNLEFLDLDNNGLTVKIADLLVKRRKDGVKIITTDNPELYPEPDDMDERLRVSSVHFRTFK